jgi:serine/threonine protein kinase
VNSLPEPQPPGSRIIGPGDVLGRYELLLPVAAGGMAMVWAARLRGSRGFQKIVAVKTMLPKLSEDPQFEKMFLDEASLASRIQHPNVVEVLDLGEQDGVLFIAMEWLDGVPLNQLMKAAKIASGIPLDVAVHFLTHAAEGLHAAHELKDDRGQSIGLVHRDVSPQNIIVGYDGFTKMVDFGLAKATALGDGATRAGQLKGKISYMAPEQVRGDPLDRRADLFALGVVLYAVTTGKHPFRRESEGATLFAISSPDPAPAPSKFIEGYPEKLETVLMKAIAKNPNDRFSTALEMARALEETLPEAERVHGGERVGRFVNELLGAQREEQRAQLAEALRRADRASLSPASATLDGLSVAGTSGVSSLSTVGITQSLSPKPFVPTMVRRFRVPLAVGSLLLAGGGLALFLTRDEAPVTEPVVAGSAVPVVEEAAPRVSLDALPVQSATPAELTVEPAPSASATVAPPVAPAPRQNTPPPDRTRKPPNWRQDPGF